MSNLPVGLCRPGVLIIDVSESATRRWYAKKKRERKRKRSGKKFPLSSGVP
jgi:hypothetical protein